MSDLLVALLGGIGATLTPCVLPLYPAFLAYLSGSFEADAAAGVTAAPRRLAPLTAAALVLFGVLLGMVVIGLVFALLAASLSRFIAVVLPIADLLLIILGLMLVLGRNPFARLPQLSPALLGRGGPAMAAFGYGLLFAPIAIPCSGPFVIAIFAFSLTIGDVASQLLFFAVFGLGFGLPLFALGLLAQWRGTQLARALVRFEHPVGVILGTVLIAIGAIDLWSNLPQLVG